MRGMEPMNQGFTKIFHHRLSLAPMMNTTKSPSIFAVIPRLMIAMRHPTPRAFRTSTGWSADALDGGGGFREDAGNDWNEPHPDGPSHPAGHRRHMRRHRPSDRRWHPRRLFGFDRGRVHRHARGV